AGRRPDLVRVTVEEMVDDVPRQVPGAGAVEAGDREIDVGNVVVGVSLSQPDVEVQDVPGLYLDRGKPPGLPSLVESQRATVGQAPRRQFAAHAPRNQINGPGDAHPI